MYSVDILIIIKPIDKKVKKAVRKKKNGGKQEFTAEQIKRMVYKDLIDTDPEWVQARIETRRDELYHAALVEMSEAEANSLADRVFWWA